MTEKKIPMTQAGYDEARKELRHYIDVIRPEVIQELKEARAQGDLSENADYDAAKNDQAEIEGRIKKIEKMLENVEIIEKGDSSVVSLGTTVSIKYVDDEDETDEYQIVGSQEADPFNNKISNESPIAAAILNKKVGETVEVTSPQGVYNVKIVSVQ